MNGKSNSALWARLACGGFLLPLVLAGCGGSSSSFKAAPTPAADAPAIVSQGGTITNSDYTLSLLPSGAATYNLYSAVPSTGIPVPEPTQTGTVSAALTAQFFKDLAAAMPLQNLPVYSGGGSAGSTNVSVQYNGQKGPVDNPNDAREQVLETDIQAIAKALGLPQY